MTTTENYFTALGWEYWKDEKNPNGLWVKYEPSIEDGLHFEVLPNITQSFPDFKKWVLEKMEKDGYKLTVSAILSAVGWVPVNSNKIETIETHGCVGIKNNEILEAAVIAATSYLLNN